MAISDDDRMQESFPIQKTSDFLPQRCVVAFVNLRAGVDL